VTATVFVDAAGGHTGGAGRFRVELYDYLKCTKRADVKVIGVGRRLNSAWLLRREIGRPVHGRLVALNNVSFVAPGGERWTRLGNPLDFLTDQEWANLHPSLRRETRLRAPVVRWAARRSDVIVTPSAGMAERVATAMPALRKRIIPRLNPVSADSVPRIPREPIILCPVVCYPYKNMVARLTEWIAAVDKHIDPMVRMMVTANRQEVPPSIAGHPRIELVGHLPHAQLRSLWARSKAIFFPSPIESFGFPLAEARVNGQPAIALATPQNREVAGPALCGFTIGDPESILTATQRALSEDLAPDPAPFEPNAYFEWLFGPPPA
jgi:glycosyltransferase involved in cell wall biosynthesis